MKTITNNITVTDIATGWRIRERMILEKKTVHYHANSGMATYLDDYIKIFWTGRIMPGTEVDMDNLEWYHVITVDELHRITGIVGKMEGMVAAFRLDEGMVFASQIEVPAFPIGQVPEELAVENMTYLTITARPEVMLKIKQQ